MWMDAYVQEILIREHMAEAQRVAASHHRLRHLKPRPTAGRALTVLQHLVRAVSIPRITRRIVRVAFQ